MLRRIWIVIVAVCAMAAGFAGCKSARVDMTDEYVPTLAEQMEAMNASANANAQVVTLYYRDASGYVVPVERMVEKQEGIAKAALMCLVSVEIDDVKLAARGVYAPIPAGTQIDLNIKDGAATVDLKMGENQCATAAEEKVMLAAVVNTLLGFSTVDQVRVWIDGKETRELPNGTPVSALYKGDEFNVEPVGAPAGADGKTMLYFGNETGSCLVPVMRVLAEDTPLMAVQEMAMPRDGTGLVSVLPPDCRVLSVTINAEGVAVVDLSKEFAAVANKPAMEAMAVKGLRACLMHFPGVKDVTLTIEGNPYVPSAATMAGAEGALNAIP